MFRIAIVCTPPSFLLGEGVEVEPPTKFSKRGGGGGGGGLTGPQLLEGSSWERGGDFFQGLKSEIFNDKKSL